MNALPRLLLPFLILLVAGCAQLPPGPGVTPGDEERIAAEIDRLRGQARILRYSARYVEALDRLDRALLLCPDDTELQAERTETEKGWRRLEQALRDELLAIETHAAGRRLPLLRRLVRANPEEQGSRDELNRILKERNRQSTALSACGRRQAEHDPALARRCLGLALAIREDAADRVLLKRLQPPAAPAGKPQARKKPTAAVATGATKAPRVAEVRDLMKAGKYYAAIRLLEEMHAENRDSMVTGNLLREARVSLERNMNTMLSTGDRLYRQGRVKEALAVWQVALEMNPESIPAREKTERALRVLHNINTLREQQ